jgi:hypothetical protein
MGLLIKEGVQVRVDVCPWRGRNGPGPCAEQAAHIAFWRSYTLKRDTIAVAADSTKRKKRTPKDEAGGREDESDKTGRLK